MLALRRIRLSLLPARTPTPHIYIIISSYCSLIARVRLAERTPPCRRQDTGVVRLPRSQKRGITCARPYTYRKAFRPTALGPASRGIVGVLFRSSYRS